MLPVETANHTCADRRTRRPNGVVSPGTKSMFNQRPPKEQTHPMATLANALKEEISRLARKEVRQQIAETVKSAARSEREIAELKRQIQTLQQKPSATRTQDAPKQPAGKKAPSKKAPSKKATAKRQGGQAAGAQSARSRFSAASLKASRERLGLSADNYGRLIGVSGLSIYNWEGGKAKPRESSIAALATIKGIGKREAVKRLEALAKEKAEKKQAAREKPAPVEKSAAGGDKGKS